jgi:hypothetical protein
MAPIDLRAAQSRDSGLSRPLDGGQGRPDAILRPVAALGDFLRRFVAKHLLEEGRALGRSSHVSVRLTDTSPSGRITGEVGPLCRPDVRQLLAKCCTGWVPLLRATVAFRTP